MSQHAATAGFIADSMMQRIVHQPATCTLEIRSLLAACCAFMGCLCATTTCRTTGSSPIVGIRTPWAACPMKAGCWPATHLQRLLKSLGARCPVPIPPCLLPIVT